MMRNLDNHQSIATVLSIVVAATLFILFRPPMTRDVVLQVGGIVFLWQHNQTLTWSLPDAPKLLHIKWHGGSLSINCTKQGYMPFKHVGHWIEFPQMYKIILQ